MTVIVEENVKAITSWSGFVYQGMIALLVTLNELNENYDYFKECILEIEKLDDFSFKDNGGDCISIHQVKCKKVDTSGGYTDAIESLKQKSASLGGVSPFLHTSVNIRDYSDPDVIRYSIEGASFVPIKDVEDMQIRALKKLVQDQFNEKQLGESEFRILNDKLNKKVVELVLDAHHENMENHTPLNIVNRAIGVQDFLQIIEDFYPGLELSITNVSSVMRQHFSIMVSDFIHDEDIDGEEYEHLVTIAEKFNNLSDLNFFQFLQILKPDEVRTTGLETKNIISLKPKGFDVPFLLFVWKTFELGSFNENKYRYEVNNKGKTLIPTGMKDSGLRSTLPFAEKLYEAMFDVKELGKLFYTGDIIVSSEVNISNLFAYMNENTDKINPYPGDGDNFIEPKKIEILNIRAALDLLGIEYD
ncbi:ABC-three component system protein [Halobacteriovorax sp. YZS-1-1]|uniref:ABC-three component system protein n=1 Tax=unclassified Halobacteriovorax TaxID=2639665 RepID=UPI00399B0BBD